MIRSFRDKLNKNFPIFIKEIIREDATYYVLVIMLVAVASFGLGRVSATADNFQAQTATITHLQTPVSEEQKQKPIINDSSLQYVASKNGSKYYLPWCSGVNRIKDENKVYFESEDLALAAGYTPAANCDSLKGR